MIKVKLGQVAGLRADPWGRASLHGLPAGRHPRPSLPGLQIRWQGLRALCYALLAVIGVAKTGKRGIFELVQVLFEVSGGLENAFIQGYPGIPIQDGFGQIDVGHAHLGIILGQLLVDELGAAV